MAFDVQLSELALKGLKSLRVYDRRRVSSEIDEQLVHQPAVPTKNRKKLDSVTADFDFKPPLWELRCDDIRVFYDVDESTASVTVQAIRRKKAGQTTEEVLHEEDDD